MILIKRENTLLISLALLVVVVALVLMNNARINKVREKLALENIPKNFNGWSGEDDHFHGAKIYDFIGADSTLLRNYRKGGFTITLYIGYYPEVREGKRPHAAKGCYTGQGWSILEDKRVNMPGDKSSLDMTRMLIKQNGVFQEVFYWFQNKKGKIYSTETKTNIALFMNKVTLQQADIAFIRVSAYVPGPRNGLCDQVIKDFISHLKPYLDNVLL